MELATIYSILPIQTPTPMKFAFISSGLLPLTSLCILQAVSSLELSPFKSPSSQSATVLNINISPTAITTSESLCLALGSRSHGMEFLCADAAGSSYNLWGFDVVYLAAWVGSTQQEKENVLVQVVEKMRSGVVLVVRSADRARRLMYSVSSRCKEVESEKKRADNDCRNSIRRRRESKRCWRFALL